MSNPYIGPRPFTDTEEHQARFFGREVEINDLCQQLRSDRILVLHAPSGAGKTSLLQAGLIPKLRAEMHQRGRGINIINPIRVGLPPTAGDGCNRWIHSVLRSIEEYVLHSEGRRLTPQLEEQLIGMDLNHYCQHRRGVRVPGQPTLLIIDQFEEIFTRDRHAHTERVELFTQLAKVLGDSGVWAVIALREEYVAALDAYKRLLPTQLASRFHLDFLTAREARESIREPADKVAGVGFTVTAVRALIDDLTGADDGESALVDPLHLQLVCYALWQKLVPERGTEIGEQAVHEAFADRDGAQRIGDGPSPVERALFSYYQEAVTGAANPAESPIGEPERRGRERRLRDFIERHLIEDERYRRQALIPEERADLAESAERLVDAHLLRAAVRPYQTWYEISHDRLVQPIRQANRLWFEGILGDVEKQARRWCQEHRPAGFPPLAAAVLDRYECDRSDGVLALGSPEEQRCEAEFVAYCRGQLRARQEHLKAKWTKKGLVLAGTLVIALLGVLWTSYQALEQGYQDLEQESIESDLSALVGQARRLTAQAMTHRWRHGDHERALLLSTLAQQRIGADSTAAMVERVGYSQSLPADMVESALWSVLQARPFSQTLPEAALAGVPVRIEGDGQVARVWVEQNGQSQVLEIAVPESRSGSPTHFGLGWLAGCEGRTLRTQHGARALYLHEQEVTLVDDRNCATPVGRVELPSAPLASVQPAWSGDGRLVAVALEPQGADTAGPVALIHAAGEPGEPGEVALRLVPTEIEAPEAHRTGRNQRRATPTALAFLDRTGEASQLAIGYNTGQIVLVAPDGEPGEPLDLTASPLWPPEYLNDPKPSQWPLNGEIVYLAVMDLDGELDTALRQLALDLPAADYELVEAHPGLSQWLLAVFHGGRTSRGGKVFLYPLEQLSADTSSGALPSVELIPNALGRLSRELDLAAGRLSVHSHGHGYIAAAYSRDGHKLLIGSNEGVLHYFDLEDLEPTRYRVREVIQSAGDYYEPLRGLGAAPNARLAVAGGYRSVSYLDGNGRGVYIDASGRQLIAIVEHRGLRLWTLDGAKVLQTLKLRPLPGDCPQPAKVRQIVVAEDAEQAVPTLETATEPAPCRVSPYVYDLVFDGKTLIASANDGLVAAYTPLADAEAHSARRLRPLWKTHRLPPTLPAGAGDEPELRSIRTADHQQSLLAAGASKGEVWVAGTTPEAAGDWQLLDAEQPLHRDGLWAVRFRPRAPGQPEERYQLASAEYHMDPGPARVFLREIDAAPTGAITQQVLGCFQFPETSVGKTRVAFSGDGCRLVLSAGAHLRVFDLEDKHCPPPHGQPAEPCLGDRQAFPPIPGRLRAVDQLDHLIYALALSRDGRYLAVGTTNGQLSWTDLDACNLVPAQGALQGHETLAQHNWLDGSRGSLLDAAFLRPSAADGKGTAVAECNQGAPRLVSVGKDATVRIWNPEDRIANPIEIAGSGNELHAVAIAEDGGLIAAGDSNGQVLVWDRDVQDYACNLVVRNLTEAEWAEHLYGTERAALDAEGLDLARLCPEAPAERLLSVDEH